MEKVFIDAQTVKCAKQFDEDALALIFEKFKPVIKAVGNKYFISGGDKDDITQEAMIALFGAIKNFDSEKSEDFVLFALRCINLRLKSAVKLSLRKKHNPLNESVDIDATDIGDYLNAYPDPEDSYIENESYRQISENVKKILSEFEFKVFILWSNGMSYREIGGIVGKDEKSVNNAVQRIKRKIYNNQGLFKK